MAAQQKIPVFNSLSDVYKSLGTTLNHSLAWENLAEEFLKRFGRKPAYIARAPGRINLIGEHIDYALFGVFPAAVERDILIACAPRDVPKPSQASEEHHTPGSVVADNLHPKYKRQIFTPKRAGSDGEETAHIEGWHLDINTQQLRWESYVKAGYFGVLNHYFPKNTEGEVTSQAHPIPVDLLVTGTVPAGSGLSSSAAMVVASTLAFLAVNGKLEDASETITKGKLVEMAMENEKRVGVNSGGMDQAASVISLADSALYVSFHPTLHAEPVPLPHGAVFVCANSLVVSDKVVHARTRYNLRVVETLVAARVLGRKLDLLGSDNWKSGKKVTLREIVGAMAGEASGEGLKVEELKVALEKASKEVETLKNDKAQAELGVTMEEMIQLSGLNEADFKEIYLSWVDVEATHFQLYLRAKHVFEEALRVLQFREICTRVATTSTSDVTGLTELGRLMNESQESCSSQFDCSCPELDELTRIARSAGAYGSRLTGAGWGGCTVSLVSEGEVDSFIAKVKESYGPYKNLEGEALNEVIFATKPSSGACVYKF